MPRRDGNRGYREEVKETKYFDYYTPFLAHLVEHIPELNHLVRQKYEPPYLRLIREAEKKRESVFNNIRKNTGRTNRGRNSRARQS